VAKNDIIPVIWWRNGKLRTSKALPATPVPPPATFADAYNKLAEKTTEIVVISVPSNLSATYQVALQAVRLMKKKCRVEVLDWQSVVMAPGFITIAAAKAAQAGASLDEVLDVASSHRAPGSYVCYL
jgi:fatty acid-binding protein DegV